MTNDQDSSSDEPFQVVLIDLQKAATRGRIHCVKKPLTEELKYVAISYRWGELQETNIDTGVGYVASITSFALQDFYKLCDTMTYESELRSIPYVWVDAICVNQSNHNERKATIYHMSEIYEHATWILAVPDLHAEHLRTLTSSRHAMYSIEQCQYYVYQLVHGNTEELCRMDHAFLDCIGVPSDQKLRQLLTKHTNCFTKGFMAIQETHPLFNDDYVISHLFDLHSTRLKKCWNTSSSRHMDIDDEIKSLHRCSEGYCPFTRRFTMPYRFENSNEWHRGIIERRNNVSQAMHFLADLIVDWSSRVWVISEFHISKKKNNLRFWFTQFNGLREVAFFKLDINDPRLKAIQNTKVESSMIPELNAPYPFFINNSSIN